MKLILPSYAYRNSYYEGISDAKKFGDIKEMGNAYRQGESFNMMLKRLKNRRNGLDLAKNDVPATIYWIINDENNLVGTIDLRHILKHNYLTTLGHVAYYIFPKYRNNGYASIALKLAIKKYKNMNISKIMITCLKSNTPSKKVIEKYGGILKKETFMEQYNDYVEEYWIDIS